MSTRPIEGAPLADRVLDARPEVDRFVAPPQRRDVESVHLEDAGAPFAEGTVVVHDEQAQVGFDLRGDREGVAGLALGRVPSFAFTQRCTSGHRFQPDPGPKPR